MSARDEARPVAWGGGFAPPVTPEPYPTTPSSPLAFEHASRGLPLEPQGFTVRVPKRERAPE